MKRGRTTRVSPDLAQLIFQHLSPRFLSRVACVNRTFRSASRRLVVYTNMKKKAQIIHYIGTVTRHSWLLQCVPKHLRTKKVCLAAMNHARRGWILALVPAPLRTKKMCMMAVTRSGLSLPYVPTHIKTEKMCLAAVAENVNALGYVPTIFRTEKLENICGADTTMK